MTDINKHRQRVLITTGHGGGMNWNDYLKTILNHYGDKPDDYVLSLGHWENKPTMIHGVELPEFQAFIRMTIGELKAIHSFGVSDAVLEKEQGTVSSSERQRPKGDMRE
jgi:hypothetical protein